jgi:integral membrane protein
MYSRQQQEVEGFSRLRLASILHGSTLLGLMGIAFPLKYYADMPVIVAIVGTCNGVTFLIYMWLAINFDSAHWQPNHVVRTLISAALPFGGFFNAVFIRKKQYELSDSPRN